MATAETDYFSINIANGFYWLEDVKAEVELDNDGGLAGVVSIFTDGGVLPIKHPLWSVIETYIDNHFDDIRGGEYTGGQFDEHRLPASQLGVSVR